MRSRSRRTELRRQDKIDPLIKEWGENIELARQRLDLTRGEFGAELGVSMTTVWRWEREGREPHRDMKARIAELTGQDVRLMFPIRALSA